MIRRKTVFVLGAGASAPYGFPSGAALAQDVCRHIQKGNHPLGAQLRDQFGDEMVRAFPDEFRRSGQYSLDAFAERRHEFRDVARFAIVHSLIPLENEARLLDPRMDMVPVAPDRDWCRYLLSKILPPDPGSFPDNRLKVLTFNFDRSFERRLFVGLKANYNLKDDQAADLAQCIPVIHIHGDLGAPAWIPERFRAGANDGLPPREYGSQTIKTTELLRKYSQRLALIGDDIPGERLAMALTALQQADVICFLGFGYHAFNLTRLRVNEIRQGEVFGTAMGVEDGELHAIRRFFDPGIRLTFFGRDDAAADIRAFLRRSSIVHD